LAQAQPFSAKSDLASCRDVAEHSPSEAPAFESQLGSGMPRFCHTLPLLALLGVYASETLPVEPEDETCLELRQLRARKSESMAEEMALADSTDSAEAEAEPDTDTDDAILDGVFSAAQGDYSDAVNSSEDELGSGWHHHHHHSGGGNIMTLYHQTSPAICNSILSGGFRSGSIGWCGGGIYFAGSPGGTYGKAVGVDSHHGCILQARVNMGRVKHMGRTCISSSRCWGKTVNFAIHCIAHGIRRQPGYDSVIFNPGDGTEFMVWDPSRVVSVRRYR